jgi:hypothetical protein
MRCNPSVTKGNSPLEGGEGRQARGDVPVGERRVASRRDIPREPKRFPPPSKGESFTAKLRLLSKTDRLQCDL